MEKINCMTARRLDLVDYLASLGVKPLKILFDDHWYRSPFRDEKTASFKVNRDLNLWYDHALGRGGNLVDFGVLYFRCSVAEFLHRLNGTTNAIISSFQPPYPKDGTATHNAGEKEKMSVPKIEVLAIRPLTDGRLLDYLDERAIPLAIAKEYCREVDFELYHRRRTVIGFPNDGGGFELRSPDFKGSSSPKGISFVNNGSDQLAVFEGFMNFLSFRANYTEPGFRNPNFLVLNSAAFFMQSRSLMEAHGQVNLFLDRDATGRRLTTDAICWNKEKFIDWSSTYPRHKDLNDWLMEKQGKVAKPQKRLGRRM